MLTFIRCEWFTLSVLSTGVLSSGSTANAGPGTSTGISSGEWQAFLSNVMIKFTTDPDKETNGNNNKSVFVMDKYFGYKLIDSGGFWHIIGDIPNIKEKGYFDVLFIKSTVVAAEPRTQL